MKPKWLVLSLVSGLVVLLVGCAGRRTRTVEPLPDAAGAKRAPVYIESSEVLLLESYPVQVELSLRGTKPTPCHELVWEVSGPDEDGRIDVAVYSLVDPEVVCIQVEEAFAARIPLGSFEMGAYTLWLNGERLAAFEAP